MNKSTLLYVSILLGLLWSAGCANRGIGPQGGPVDSIPPQLVKSMPVNATRNFKGKTISLHFDEYIQLDNPSENILVSPPQQTPPEISAVGKKIKVVFQDELKENTTYTVDFGSAIQDNNEKNPMKNFAITFSTGNELDSLEMYGTLINAENLNPMPGIVVGFHSDLSDSAFSTKIFDRVGRTNADGEFSILNIKEGTYRLYGLGDASRDFKYQPGEGLAMHDELLTPTIKVETENDTIWRDSLQGDSMIHYADSVYTTEYYYYEPSDILLRYFKEDKKHLYFERLIRPDQHRFTLCFSAPVKEVPQLKALRLSSDSLAEDSTWIDWIPYTLCQPNGKGDSITYWLTDSLAIRMDTLRFEISYQKTDSVYNLVTATDTMTAVYRHPKVKNTASGKKATKTTKKAIQLGSNARKDFHVDDTLCITSPIPLLRINEAGIHLAKKQDTIWIPVKIDVKRKDSTRMHLQIVTDLRSNTEYRLRVDTACMLDIYGDTLGAQEWNMSVRSLETYSTIRIHLEPYEPRAFVQLLNEKDVPVITLPAQKDGILFRHINPGIYYMRMFIDANGDGKWTTGDWSKKRQPEEVFYFSKKLNLRANWDFEETFRWQAIPLLNQKPKALIIDNPSKKSNGKR